MYKIGIRSPTNERRRTSTSREKRTIGDEQMNIKGVMLPLKEGSYISGLLTPRVSHHHYQSSSQEYTSTTAGAHKGRWWWRWRSRIIDAHFPLDDLESLEHFPPRTERRNALRLERLLVHQHHSPPRHTLKSSGCTCAVSAE